MRVAGEVLALISASRLWLHPGPATAPRPDRRSSTSGHSGECRIETSPETLVEESKEAEGMDRNLGVAVNLQKYDLLTVPMIRRVGYSIRDAGQRTGLGHYIIVLCVSGKRTDLFGPN